MSDLVEDLLAGKHSALARVITQIENRSPGYREIISDLHQHTGTADVIGVTGSPGAGKSTLVDKVAATYREQGLTVGVIAIDPSSPFSGGAVLGDRIRMASNAGDMDMFFRSMSARGSLGGLSTATTDAVTALDAFGKDKIIVETVGAGQNEVDIVRTADTVAVLVPPGSGDDVQMLKAGILEIGDVFVVNKADLDGADRTVQQLREMLQGRSGRPETGHHGATELAGHAESDDPHDDDAESESWNPPIVETVANRGEGVEDFLETLADHGEYLDRTGRREGQARERFAAEIRTLLREDANELLADELDRRGGIDSYVDAVIERHTDPYTVVDEILTPLRDCLDERRDEA
ncbi:methylmalonyl Co-A mutase-associated GTPase MeaB [Haloarcula mannanilytica]|uniref:Methylmalonyl Co-A mutase-associated GTPase MeaB n=1 Tax=Haloarcula mannanilytica TaxID=2509225 RepID=A0A4C2ECG4_9EURY|nr:methylmalonyl Co-A mutase-associated GTPase MeaB [Haloarcula mannanilytica]GCF12195.1 methylmalonyl Co-A mutase-associated GTPase MeaB [Haloarcula mannanilytica]